MRTRVNIDVARIRSNRETGATEPVIRVVRDGEVSFAHTLEILGPSSVVYDPTRSGTSCWIETDSEVRMSMVSATAAPAITIAHPFKAEPSNGLEAQ